MLRIVAYPTCAEQAVWPWQVSLSQPSTNCSSNKAAGWPSVKGTDRATTSERRLADSCPSARNQIASSPSLRCPESVRPRLTQSHSPTLNSVGVTGVVNTAFVVLDFSTRYSRRVGVAQAGDVSGVEDVRTRAFPFPVIPRSFYLPTSAGTPGLRQWLAVLCSRYSCTGGPRQSGFTSEFLGRSRHTEKPQRPGSTVALAVERSGAVRPATFRTCIVSIASGRSSLLGQNLRASCQQWLRSAGTLSACQVCHDY